jgi:hypothetical protein
MLYKILFAGATSASPIVDDRDDGLLDQECKFLGSIGWASASDSII